MHPRRLAVAITATLACTLTACSGSVEPEGGAGNAKPALSSPNAKASPTPSPSADLNGLKYGESIVWDAEDFDGEPIAGEVTILGYQQPIDALVSADEDKGTDGYVWSALEVKTCSTKGSFTVDNTAWVLAYPDGARYESSSTTYDDFPKPEYPVQAQLSEGNCIRGKIVYAVPGDQRPDVAMYAPYGANESASWPIPSE